MISISGRNQLYLRFLDGDSHYKKLATETINFVWVFPDVPNHAQAGIYLLWCL